VGVDPFSLLLPMAAAAALCRVEALSRALARYVHCAGVCWHNRQGCCPLHLILRRRHGSHALEIFPCRSIFLRVRDGDETEDSGSAKVGPRYLQYCTSGRAEAGETRRQNALSMARCQSEYASADGMSTCGFPLQGDNVSQIRVSQWCYVDLSMLVLMV
jgi:hypothetical protein